VSREEKLLFGEVIGGCDAGIVQPCCLQSFFPLFPKVNEYTGNGDVFSGSIEINVILKCPIHVFVRLILLNLSFLLFPFFQFCKPAPVSQ
jgi:hypothetical protein